VLFVQLEARLPPMIIFKGKTDKTIQDLRIPTGFIVKTQESLDG